MSQGLLTLHDIRSNTLNSNDDSDIDVQAPSGNVSFVTSGDKQVIIGNVFAGSNTVVYDGNLEIVKELTLENKVKVSPGGIAGGILSSEKNSLILTGSQITGGNVLVADSTLVGYGNEVDGVTEGIRVKGTGLGELSIAHDRPNNRSVFESKGDIDIEFCSGFSQTTLNQSALVLTPNAGVANSNAIQSNSLATAALQQSQHVSSIQPSSVSDEYGMLDLADPVAQIFTGYDTRSTSLLEMQGRALFGKENDYPWRIDVIFKTKVVVTKVRLVGTTPASPSAPATAHACPATTPNPIDAPAS